MLLNCYLPIKERMRVTRKSRIRPSYRIIKMVFQYIRILNESRCLSSCPTTLASAAIWLAETPLQVYFCSSLYQNEHIHTMVTEPSARENRRMHMQCGVEASPISNLNCEALFSVRQDPSSKGGSQIPRGSNRRTLVHGCGIVSSHLNYC